MTGWWGVFFKLRSNMAEHTFNGCNSLIRIWWWSIVRLSGIINESCNSEYIMHTSGSNESAAHRWGIPTVTNMSSFRSVTGPSFGSLGLPTSLPPRKDTAMRQGHIVCQINPFETFQQNWQRIMKGDSVLSCRWKNSLSLLEHKTAQLLIPTSG